MGRKRPLNSTSSVKEADAAAKNTPTTSTINGNKNATKNVKLEIEEPDIIPLDSPPQKLQRKSCTTENDKDSLYASASSQERFRRAMALSNDQNVPSISNNPYPYRQYPSQSEPQYHRQPEPQYHRQPEPQYQPRHSDSPRVIIPRGVRAKAPTFQSQSYQQLSPQLPSTSTSSYRPIGAFQPSSSPSLPQYRDKRIREQRDNEEIQCPECNLVLKNLFAYTTHRNYVHGSVVRAKIPCPQYGCLVMSTSMVALVRHLNNFHRYSLQHEQHIFKNEDHYMEWFRNLVEDGSVSFVRSSSIKNNESASGSVSFLFYCDHAGRKYLNNSAGTIKMNATCPAYFRMTKHSTGHVSIYAQLRHLGHDCSPKYKTIESHPPLRNTLIEIEIALALFKGLAKTPIPIEYPMENNSLVVSAIELLNNIKTDFARAKNLIDGIVPDEKGADEEYPAFDENDINIVAQEE